MAVMERGRTEERIAQLEAKVDWGFKSVNQRFDHVDKRFEAMEARFDTMNDRLHSLNRTLVTGIFGAFVAVLVTQL